MSNHQGKIDRQTFLRFVDKQEIELGEILITETGPSSWDVGIKVMANSSDVSLDTKAISSEAEKASALSEIHQTFGAEHGWIEYKPGRTVGSIRLLISQNHSDFVQISMLDDDSGRSNIEVRTFSNGLETFREVLSYPNSSKRDAASRELRDKFSHSNGWYLFTTSHGWDELSEKTMPPLVPCYVRLAGIFEEEYEFCDVSNRNEAVGRAEIEFADYSVVERFDQESFAFEKTEVQTKAIKAADGSTYMQAKVTGWWWSDYYAVEATCLDEAEQMILRGVSDRYAVIGSWDPEQFIEFKELKPLGTRVVQQTSLPQDFEDKLDAIQDHSSSPPKFSVADLEWIFFGAIDYQLVTFGGALPAIDYGESGTDFFQKWGRPNFGSEIGIYWPPSQMLDPRDEALMLDLFLRYRAIWDGDPVYSDFLSLEVIVSLEIPWLGSPQIRRVIHDQICQQEWGQYSFLASETARLLRDEPAFAS